jgi:ATP-dependent RNA helicase RhlE
MKFADLQLSAPILRALVEEGYETATPIQAQTIPYILEGRDVLGSAQTGTGKTAAFALPILHRLTADTTPVKGKRLPRCLVLSPTRELAVQIADSFKTYGKHLPINGTVIYGGVGQNPQVAALRRNLDVIIATPGRLLDLINQGHVDLSGIEVLVLDEADRMLDMGFIHDINRIVDLLPGGRQTLLFSATMPPAIRKFADRLLDQPERVEVAPQSTTADRIEQVVYHVDRGNKSALLKHLIENTSISRAIVFTRTKHGADKVVRHLCRDGTAAEAIHGNKSQNARQKALDGFRSGRVHILVATDVAARGIDVDDISHVINYDLSNDPESYVHRIGRTARAGAAGIAISFCDREERGYLTAIQRLIRKDITVCKDQPAYAPREASSHDDDRDERPSQPKRGGHHGGNRPEGRGKPSRTRGGKPAFASAGGAGVGKSRRGGRGAGARPQA